MTAMHTFFASGHVVDMVIALLALELLVLRVGLRRTAVLPLPTLLAGIGLLLAWRFSQAGWPWGYAAAALSAAGAAHGWDLWRLWRSR
jgi:hypothetical protein